MGGPPYDPHGGMQDQYPTGAIQTFNGGGGGHGDVETHGGGGGHGDPHGGEEHGGGHGHGATIDKETGITPRRCTDIQCCFVWLVFSILLLTLLNMSWWYGDVTALTHGRDYYGRICGVSAGVENMPWLYWCRDDAPSTLAPAALQMSYPSCVAACPASLSETIKIPCLRKAATVETSIEGGQFGNVKTQMVTMQESLISTAPYPTFGRGGRFCIPKDLTLRDTLLADPVALHPGGRIMRMVMAGTLGNLSWLFFVTTIIATGFGYFFFWAIKYCPKALTKILVYPASALVGVVAIFLLLAILPLAAPDLEFSAKYRGLNGLYAQYTVQNASAISIVFAVIAGIVSATLFGMGWNFDGAVVGDLVNAGMQCMNQVPGMYYLPLISAVVKWLVFLFFVQGLRWFFSVGMLHKNRIHVNGAEFAGLSREWNWNHWWIAACVIWLVGFYWAMEIVNCFFEYLISKGTVAWYFTPKEGGKKKKAASSWLKDGVKEAFLYHWGSITYGAFFIPTWRPMRLFYWATASLGGPPGSVPTTFFGKAIACIDFCDLKDCCGLKEVAKEKVQSNESNIKDGFTDIVIRANDFAAASEKAHMLLEHSHKVVQHMYRDMTQTTLCVLGVTVISSICAVVTFLIVSLAKPYKEPSSDLYIANPGLVVFLSWILGAYIAFGFMMTWDHTADTLLYCYAWNVQFSRKSVEKFVPDTVRNIVGVDDKEEDRYPYYGKASASMYLRSWIPGIDKKAEKKTEVPKGMPKEGQGYSPQASWFNAGSWVGSMPPQQAPPGMTQPQEMQSLLQR